MTHRAAPIPIYSSANVTPAYQLRYTWSGWPSSAEFPQEPTDEFFQALDVLWEGDGLRRLETRWTPKMIQFTFSVTPHVSPCFFTARVKGRLQHALRLAAQPVDFSRKVSFRTIGNNRTATVERYIESQVGKERFVDPQFVKLLEQFTVSDSQVDLQQPSKTHSGRYWYNLHLVLVAQYRTRFTDVKSLAKICRLCRSIATNKGHAISIQSVMPDHLHLALRGNVEHSPEQIALAMMNNIAYAFRQNPIWESSFYTGTFGEYDMNAVRVESTSPTNLPGG